MKERARKATGWLGRVRSREEESRESHPDGLRTSRLPPGLAIVTG